MASVAQRGSLWGMRKDKGTARAAGATAKQQHSLEHRILITATMCLLAFGAVMVYSASSATTLLQGRGNGSGYLIKYVMYGAVGLVLMRVLARDGVAKVQSVTAPLLEAPRSTATPRNIPQHPSGPLLPFHLPRPLIR
jgi:hypothetical protein